MHTMNFHELTLIIRDIQKNIPCRVCKKTVDDKNIGIIGTIFNEGFFHARCEQCGHDMIINVTLRARNGRPHRPLHSKNRMKLVNQNDILDMRNFLKNFNGDFISLFQNQR